MPYILTLIRRDWAACSEAVRYSELIVSGQQSNSGGSAEESLENLPCREVHENQMLEYAFSLSEVMTMSSNGVAAGEGCNHNSR